MPKTVIESESDLNYQRQKSPENKLSYTALRKQRKKESKTRREKEGILEAEGNKKKLDTGSKKYPPYTKETEDLHVINTEEEHLDNKGVHHTVSIAIPGSIIENAQSGVLKTYLAGQIGRAAAIFKISEIIIYDDTSGKSSSACKQLAQVLQYLECPQYLRKFAFPIHEDLQYVGVVSPLDIPHHLRQHEFLPFREGIVTTQPMKKGQTGSYVNIGLSRDVKVDKVLKSGTRVTVELGKGDIQKQKGKLRGTLVSPSKPVENNGIYWGYSVRIATSLGAVFSNCPFGNGHYDTKIGTSEKGTPLSELKLKKSRKHFLIVFGGVEGLEYALENDETLLEDNVANLFDHYLNTCPCQGSRTIRTEEAVLISMTALNSLISNIC